MVLEELTAVYGLKGKGFCVLLVYGYEIDDPDLGEVYKRVCSNVVVELHALRLGLLLAWEEVFCSVECEIDAKVVLDLIKEVDVIFHPLRMFIADHIRELLHRDKVCSIHHTLRKGNFSADKLSKLGCSLDEDYAVFRSPPQEVLDVLQAEVMGVAYPRGFKML
ncbi:hypothetical protein CCACVL1_18338 [Corchorus capsularis]|uniref:RNase H type-1 domain-containing protein n=1 Tax=Corchorus capsularis TaxID=210143 RepID=A0A1R3HLS2_COCAP|nr:hypothetical protein CCACVL1_18338 [Corchorus capsularis]